MAADGVNKLQLKLVHGQSKYDLELVLSEDKVGDVLSVADLAKQVEQLTGVPQAGQRLIHKGKSLKTPTESLKSQGLKDGSKILLIGKKLGETASCSDQPSSATPQLHIPMMCDPEEDENIKTLKGIEEDLLKQEKHLSDLTYELDGVQQGYLPKDFHATALPKISKRLIKCNEELMRLLEKLDALTLGQDCSTEARAKRKSLVNRIQDLLSRCDNLGSGLKEMASRLKITV